MTLNDQRRATWRTVRAAKSQVEEAAFYLAKQQKVTGLGPSIVSCVWFAPDKRRRDADSVAPFLKAALDGLVKAGVWPDDNSDFVTEVRMSIDNTQSVNPRIEIIVKEI